MSGDYWLGLLSFGIAVLTLALAWLAVQGMITLWDWLVSWRPRSKLVDVRPLRDMDAYARRRLGDALRRDVFRAGRIRCWRIGPWRIDCITVDPHHDTRAEAACEPYVTDTAIKDMTAVKNEEGK